MILKGKQLFKSYGDLEVLKGIDIASINNLSYKSNNQIFHNPDATEFYDISQQPIHG